MIPAFSPEIRRILLNFLTRRWHSLVWIGSFYLLASFAVVKALAADPESKLNPVRFIFPMSVSFWLVLIDVSAKPIRSLLALPVTANSLWNSYWWLTFGLPAIAFTFISILGLAGAWMTGPLALPFDKVLILFFEQWGALALGWCCLSLLPSGDDVTKRRPISSTIAGAFRGLQMALFVFVIPNSFLWQSIILGVSGCTIVVALFGKRLTGQFILERIGRPDHSVKPVFIRQSGDRPIGPFGWRALICNVFRKSPLEIAFIGLIWSGFAILENHDKIHTLRESFIGFPVIPFLASCSFALTRESANAIRVFRQLPIGASRLTLILMLSGYFPFLVWYLAFALGQLVLRCDLSQLWSYSILRLLSIGAVGLCWPAIYFHSRADRWLMLGLIISIVVPILFILGVLETIMDSSTRYWILLGWSVITAFFWTRAEISSGRTAYQSPVTNTDPIST